MPIYTAFICSQHTRTNCTQSFIVKKFIVYEFCDLDVYFHVITPHASRIIFEHISFDLKVLGQYIENLMAASNVFQATGESKGRKA